MINVRVKLERYAVRPLHFKGVVTPLSCDTAMQELSCRTFEG